MKVLYVSLAKGFRGGEKSLVHLLQENQNFGVASVLACRAGSPLAQFALKNNIPVLLLKMRTPYSLLAARRIKQYCSQHKITILHAWEAHAHTLCYLAHVVWRLSLPLIASRHVLMPIRKKLLTNLKYKSTQLKKLICVSPAVFDIAQQFVAREKLMVIPPTIDLTAFAPRKNFAKKVARIVYVAAFTPEKDHFTFINTAKILIDQGIAAEFVLYGDGPDRAMIAERVAELGLTDYLTFAGQVYNMPDRLAEADLLLFTSKNEAFGMAILEAFAANVAVVATESAGVKASIPHNCYLAAPIGNAESLAQQVRTALENSQEAMLHSAREFAAGFDKKLIAKRFYEIYQ